MKRVIGRRYKRTLFVGLGGAGAKTLRRLKQKFLETNEGHIPEQIKFLLIDTNATELANYRDFDSNEKVCIAVREPYLRYQHDKQLGVCTHELIPENNVHSLLALERGAGQVRSNGHFAVIENQYSNKLMRVFRERVDEMEDIDVDGGSLEKDPKVEIRLVFSLAGGTGSGTFLPIASIIRAAIKHSELTAYIYSATHYEKFVENSAKYSVMQNAYAALCELDYMMHFGRPDYNNVTFNFGPEDNQKIEAQNRPFDEVYYIDKRSGIPTPDSLEYVYNEIKRLQDNTAEIMHISSSSIISAHTGTVDNVRQKIMEGQFDVGDKFAWISGVGIAELLLNKEAISNERIASAALEALKIRLASDCNTTWAQQIANDFILGINYKEDQHDDDGDPILSKYASLESIEAASLKVVKGKNPDNKSSNSQTKSEQFSISLDDIIESDKKSKSISEALSLNFDKKLVDLIRQLVDNLITKNKDEEVKPIKEGLSFEMILLVLSNIRSMLKRSQDTLHQEASDHDQNRQNADKDIDTVHKNHQNQQQQQAQPASWTQRVKNVFTNTPNHVQQNTNALSAQVFPYQVNGVKFKLLKERATKAEQLFKDCIEILDNYVDDINTWVAILKEAQKYGLDNAGNYGVYESSDNKTKKRSNPDKRNRNVVEIQALNPKGSVFKYDNLVTFSNDVSHNRIQNPQGKFERVLNLVKTNSFELLQYLKNGLQEIDKLAKDGHIKVKRTECQEQIDSLIDLSTPTMQIDRHGYGERINLDHFWYIMTDCPEENEGDKENGKKDSVGSLLKKLIQQNSLDVKPHLIHVEGWTDKAVLYRVDSAVPAYFVEGVCQGEYGGHTLEGCYEELKKTKRTYTPFSHKDLQEKLENAVCVLKPHDDVAENEAMEHWVNFILLGLINFESTKGTNGKYTIKSNKLGKVKDNKLDNLVKIFDLGKTRVEAFNTFSRYCKTLVEENLIVETPEGFCYKEAIDHLEYPSIQNYEDKFIISGTKYLDTIFVDADGSCILKWHDNYLNWQDYNKHLDENDPEYKQLKKEVEFIEARTSKYNDAKTE